MPSRTMQNRYAKGARISERQIRGVVRCFAADLTALQATQLSRLNRNTMNRLCRGLRERLQAACEAQRPLFGVVEVDESWFGPRNMRGKRGRGAYGKTIVFGIFERAGQVYTEVVPDCSRATLQGIIRGRVDVSSVINSDGWRGYNGLVDLGYGTCASTTETTSSPTARYTSTASKASGASPRSASPSSKACPNIPSISISRRPSGATTTDRPTTIKPC